MRTPRAKGEGRTCYHVMSRIVDRVMRLGPAEKDRFTDLMRACGAFCGVRLHTHAIMDNHFHILVEADGDQEIPEEEVVRRMRALYPEAEVEARTERWRQWRAEGLGRLAEADLAALRARMGDVSAFMKTLKQRFSQWYNRENDRRGTLWEDRFKSVLVENGRALQIIRAYIEHNPVRAGIVSRPEDYRWCGRWRAKAEPSVAPETFTLDLEAVIRSLEGGEKLDHDALMLCRVRYFSDGLAFGSREFVDGVYRRNRPLFGHTRQDGARPMRRAALEGLFIARNLRKDAVIASPVLEAAAAGPPATG